MYIYENIERMGLYVSSNNSVNGGFTFLLYKVFYFSLSIILYWWLQESLLSLSSKSLGSISTLQLENYSTKNNK